MIPAVAGQAPAVAGQANRVFVIKLTMTYVFIDATNIIYGTSYYGWKMDFEKLFKYLTNRYEAKAVYYYAGVDSKNVKQLNFYKKLTDFGYKLRLVPVKIFSDGHKKADVDSRMTFEIIKLDKKFDKAIIMTGDGDYYWVLEYLIKTKKMVKLISHNRNTARELKKLFGKDFVDMEDIRYQIERK